MVSFTVAIDGPAAAGKGTIGRAIASHFGFQHLDTGLLYRVVAKILMERRDDGESEEQQAAHIAEHLCLHDTEMEGLRSAEVSRESSRIAAMPAVREALLSFQRRFARREGGAVLDGRDIGSIIAPDSEVKLFVTASEQVRAARRHHELVQMGGSITLEEVLSDLRQRDARDIKRGLAALQKVEDALLLDTSNLTIEQAVSEAIAAVEVRFGTGLDDQIGRESCGKEPQKNETSRVEFGPKNRSA